MIGEAHSFQMLIRINGLSRTPRLRFNHDVCHSCLRSGGGHLAYRAAGVQCLSPRVSYSHQSSEQECAIIWIPPHTIQEGFKEGDFVMKKYKQSSWIGRNQWIQIKTLLGSNNFLSPLAPLETSRKMLWKWSSKPGLRSPSSVSGEGTSPECCFQGCMSSLSTRREHGPSMPSEGL